MCLAIPGQVIEIRDEAHRLARISVAGVERTINVALLDDEPEGPAKAGDWVLIHVGFAISRVDESEARETLALLERLGSDYQDELDELRASAIE